MAHIRHGRARLCLSPTKILRFRVLGRGPHNTPLIHQHFYHETSAVILFLDGSWPSFHERLRDSSHEDHSHRFRPGYTALLVSTNSAVAANQIAVLTNGSAIIGTVESNVQARNASQTQSGLLNHQEANLGSVVGSASR
jgi:hypothetical protein